ncbi:MAG TPA: hypothetical protein ENN11_00405 [Methanomicrobia archaeon]|nr:hypothetical protein [Methanomicrobia archaeon]
MKSTAWGSIVVALMIVAAIPAISYGEETDEQHPPPIERYIQIAEHARQRLTAYLDTHEHDQDIEQRCEDIALLIEGAREARAAGDVETAIAKTKGAMEMLKGCMTSLDVQLLPEAVDAIKDRYERASHHLSMLTIALGRLEERGIEAPLIDAHVRVARSSFKASLVHLKAERPFIARQMLNVCERSLDTAHDMLEDRVRDSLLPERLHHYLNTMPERLQAAHDTIDEARSGGIDTGEAESLLAQLKVRLHKAREAHQEGREAASLAILRESMESATRLDHELDELQRRMAS